MSKKQTKADTFKMYAEWYSIIQATPEVNLGESMKLAFDYLKNRILPCEYIDPVTRLLFEVFKHSIDEADAELDFSRKAGYEGAEVRKLKKELECTKASLKTLSRQV